MDVELIDYRSGTDRVLMLMKDPAHPGRIVRCDPRRALNNVAGGVALYLSSRQYDRAYLGVRSEHVVTVLELMLVSRTLTAKLAPLPLHLTIAGAF